MAQDDRGEYDIEVLVGSDEVIQVEVDGNENAFKYEVYNDVADMPDKWYWRDKPLNKNTVKVG